MSGTILAVTILVVCAVGLFVFRAIPGVRAYFEYRGKRLVICPETHKTAAVDVAAGEAAVGAFLSKPTLRLQECSRWPERKNCGQDCLHQVDRDPEKCLVWNLVSKWYEDKKWVLCHKPIGQLHHLDHAPALLGPGQVTVEWKEMNPEALPGVFSTHLPVCWDCHVAAKFRRLFPERVVDREPEPRRMA